MDTETFILSVRERSAVWDQQQSSHHNRFILDRMWKEIGQENNCTVKEAQKKWKGLRDYYRSEFRKTQKERSGQGADTVYKPNWPYFMSLDFLREQFQVRPSSGNITLSEHRSEKRKAVQTEITEVSDNNPDSPDNEEDEHNVTDDTLMNDNTPSVATTTVNNETQTFTHTNDFRKRTGRQDHIQQLVQLEEKKLYGNLTTLQLALKYYE
ncbi:hypothetical protein J6590_065588 [Homalodisca vitripennis]|nr:hypothetical protein J6590_065588 [Homalodisca vitripennis]